MDSAVTGASSHITWNRHRDRKLRGGEGNTSGRTETLRSTPLAFKIGMVACCMSGEKSRSSSATFASSAAEYVDASTGSWYSGTSSCAGRSPPGTGSPRAPSAAVEDASPGIVEDSIGTNPEYPATSREPREVNSSDEGYRYFWFRHKSCESLYRGRTTERHAAGGGSPDPNAFARHSGHAGLCLNHGTRHDRA